MDDYKKMGGLNDKNWDDRVRRITGTSNQADASADVTTPSADTSRPTISNDVANASASDAAIRRTVGGEEPASMKTRRIRRSNGAASARLANELSRVLSGASLTGLVEAYIQRSISIPKMAKRISSSTPTVISTGKGKSDGEGEGNGPSDDCIMIFGSLNDDDDDDDDDVLYV